MEGRKSLSPEELNQQGTRRHATDTLQDKPVLTLLAQLIIPVCSALLFADGAWWQVGMFCLRPGISNLSQKSAYRTSLHREQERASQGLGCISPEILVEVGVALAVLTQSFYLIFFLGSVLRILIFASHGETKKNL